jgi:DNA-directed RNA polymerase subunit H (RpoH/RPB5)
MQALFELQENIRIGRREKFVIDSRIHSVIGRFPVTVSIIDTGNIAKASRDKSTLCNLTVTYRIDYPIIGNVQLDNGDVIKVIRANEYTMPTDYMDTNLIGKDVILPDNDEIIQELLDKGSITEEHLKY